MFEKIKKIIHTFFGHSFKVETKHCTCGKTADIFNSVSYRWFDKFTENGKEVNSVTYRMSKERYNP